ncbi:DUF6314 family protein [Novosphingobium sp. TCA1]|uniref:DUF6314 family protein n=1 Tax=Novosphingobium sp. TCA1 TaxID=2682474 RepID=UPI001308A27E|nr:DUF6314 family protein [Novosphingobium sp. TCA1]GFE76123.1 hypothetical protein NTCA1_37720 [Novosphingobium sp. TCA1]
MIEGPSLLRSLSGAWQLDREIRGVGAQLHGEATFEPGPDGAFAYRECGTLRLRDGRELSSHRRYSYRPSEGGFTVAFADGPTIGSDFVRLTFQALDGERLVADDVHHCGDDIYEVRYVLALPSAFETIIDVTGPAKAYRLISSYVR